MQYEFTKRVLGSYHPNSVLVELTGGARTVKVLASSLGGGKVEVQELDEYPFKFSGERPTLVIRHSDQKGINIARMANERSKINGAAITVCEIDNIIEDTLISLLKREISIIDEIVLVQTK
ncbi:ACT domain-containing protein [Peribacillus frigoritolerans]|uniref:hypothetical protein n=1 Tax=Peribacillus frigoritolerans TaxID=450367 RepID=UPI00381B7A78